MKTTQSKIILRGIPHNIYFRSLMSLKTIFITFNILYASMI